MLQTDEIYKRLLTCKSIYLLSTCEINVDYEFVFHFNKIYYVNKGIICQKCV